MKRVLIVEDDKYLADKDVWERACENDGLYEFDIARSGEDAIEKIESDRDNEIKVLVVDLKMPVAKIDGRGFLEWLSEKNWQRFGIVVFTAFPDVAGQILGKLHIPSWIFAKGKPVDHLKILKDIFRSIMLRDDISSVSLNSVEEKVAFIEDVLRSIHSAKDLDYLRKVCQELEVAHKNKKKAIKQHYLKDWIRVYQAKGYFTNICVDEDTTFHWTSYKINIPSGERIYYKLLCYSHGSKQMVGVPMAILDSFLSVLSKIQQEEEQFELSFLLRQPAS